MAELSNINQRLTSGQIADFNNPLAFARERTNNIGASPVETAAMRRVNTTDIEASYRLVSGAVDRMKTLYGNLQTMMQLVEQARHSRNSERRTQEIFGKLRSLGAGFDQLADSIRFDGRPIFNGNEIQLSLGSGLRAINLETKNLSTHGEGGLNLSMKAASAEVTIRTSGVDVILNSATPVPGLDLASGEFIEPQAAHKELESGTYKVMVTYQGAASAVELRDESGKVIERKEGVDLSGSGVTTVDFEAGVRLGFDKDNKFLTFDKYDYEFLGPATFSSTLIYRRLDRHVLTTNEEIRPNEASFAPNASLRIGDGAISVADPAVVAGDSGRSPLSSGNYRLSIEFLGRDSVVRLRDFSGRLVGHKFGVDLSESGVTRVDLGVGLAFDIVNDGFVSEKANMETVVSYHRERPPVEEFDFREFGRRVEAAMDVVVSQLEMFLEVQGEIEEAYAHRNEFRSGASLSLSALRSQNATALISGQAAGFFFGAGRRASPEAQLAVFSMQLFQSVNAARVQANQTEESLRMARQSTASDWLGGFI